MTDDSPLRHTLAGYELALH